MRSWLACLALAIGCKSSPPPSSPPPPPPPSTGSPAEPGPARPGPSQCAAPEEGKPMTPEQCTCLGGRMNPSRGGEQEHCARNETELGAVRFGIEGGWCCKAP